MSLELLLVDDSEDESAAIRDNASSEYQVTWTTEAVEACTLLSRRSFDLIMLDLTLPDEWGLDGLVRVSTLAPETPVLALGMPGDEELGRHAVIAGAAGFVMKEEIARESLETVVQETLDHHESRITEEYRQRDPQTNLYDRQAFLLQAERRLKLAAATGKSVLLLTASLEAEEGSDRVSSAAEALRMTFRNSDLLGRTGDHQFASLSLVHPTDDSDAILAHRIDEILQTKNTKDHPDDPLRVVWQMERIDPETCDDLADRIERLTPA